MSARAVRNRYGIPVSLENDERKLWDGAADPTRVVLARLALCRERRRALQQELDRLADVLARLCYRFAESGRPCGECLTCGLIAQAEEAVDAERLSSSPTDSPEVSDG